MASMSSWGKARSSGKASAKNKGLHPVKVPVRRVAAGSGSYLAKGNKKK